MTLTIKNIVGDPHMPHSDVVKIGRSYLLGRCCRRKLWNGPPTSPTLPSQLTYCQERYGARPVALEQVFDLSLCYFLLLQPTCIETSISRHDSSQPDTMFPRNDKDDENAGLKSQIQVYLSTSSWRTGSVLCRRIESIRITGSITM